MYVVPKSNLGFNDFRYKYLVKKEARNTSQVFQQINEDEFMVTLAVAGFSMDNLDVTKEGNVLSIEGSKNPSDDTVNYLHKGIAERTFRRDFTLADHVDVRSADLELGMLNIHLVREVPEAMKPKKIAINSETTIDAVGYDNK